MSSIEATSTSGEAARPPVPVEHPAWCDRSLCTAPEFRPTEPGERYAHRSANLLMAGDWPPDRYDYTQEAEAYLSQAVARWECATYLRVGDASIRINYDSPLLFAVMDEHAALTEKWPNLMATGRERARANAIASAKEAPSDASA